jgi:glycine cleavage system aminomethyltransferase T
LTDDDVSNEGFPFVTCRPISLGTIRAVASRISYVGELGWEIYAPFEEGRRLWDLLWEAGQPLGAVPVGIGVYATTARLEKSYRAHGNELELDFDLVEDGMARKTVKDDDFVGRDAYLKQRDSEPAAVLSSLTLDDATSPTTGVRRYMMGREPVQTPDGEPLVDAKGRRSYVSSAGSAPTLGTHVLMSYLPPAHAVVGTKLSVLYMGDRYPVTVAGVGATPLFDPSNERMKA